MSVDNIELLLKARKLELLRKKHEAIKANGLSFYQPHAKQDLFHRAGRFKHRYARTGNRFGKSTMGAAEDASFAIGGRLWMANSDPDKTIGIPQRPTKGLVVCEDWDKATEIFTSTRGDIGKLFQMLPSGCVDMHKGIQRNHSGAIDKIIVKRPAEYGGGESTIYFDTVKSFKQNNMSQESSDWDWFHADEPCPQKMFTAIARGLIDRNGSSWFLCTPISEIWINDMFVPSRATRVDDGLPLITESNRWMITGETAENPTLSQDAIDDFSKLLSPEEKDCRLRGIPLALSGLVYKEFSDSKHVLTSIPTGWTDFDSPPLDYTIRYSIDPHARTPHAVLFTATAPTEEVFYWHEIFDQCPISELAARIKARVENRFVALAMIDPIAYIPSPIDGKTWADEFMENLVFLQKAPKDLTHGIQAVKAALRQTKKYFFSPLLRRTRWEFDHYIWDQEKDKPKDVDDHMMENLYRLIISDHCYIKPPSDDDWDVKDITDKELFDGAFDLSDL